MIKRAILSFALSLSLAAGFVPYAFALEDVEEQSFTAPTTEAQEDPQAEVADEPEVPSVPEATREAAEAETSQVEETIEQVTPAAEPSENTVAPNSEVSSISISSIEPQEIVIEEYEPQEITLEAAVSSIVYQYSDVSNKAYYTNSVYKLRSLLVMTGYANTSKFGVGDACTRAQMASLIWRCKDPKGAAKASSSAKNTTGLPDVEDKKWYTAAVNWAVKNKIMTGKKTSEGTFFDPEVPLTFQEALAVLYNAAGASEKGDRAYLSAHLADASSVSGWALAAVTWAHKKGVFSGEVFSTNVRYINPKADVPRERLAAVIANAMNKKVLPSEIPINTSELTTVEKNIALSLLAEGCDATHIAAILGNMYMESGVNPALQAKGSSGKVIARGLMMWETDPTYYANGETPWKQLESWAKARGLDPTTEVAQTKYLIYTLDSAFRVYGNYYYKYNEHKEPYAYMYKNPTYDGISGYGGNGAASLALKNNGMWAWLGYSHFRVLYNAVASFERCYGRGSIMQMDRRVAFAQSYYDKLTS